ncbi:MAG: hypothetical protein M3P51_08705, partial [Chloroflexota bacterium]|nr:hypothetical protein [Chloroflexota bacterium]
VVLDIPVDSQPGVSSAESAAHGMPSPTEDTAALRARLAAVEEERDHLRATVDKLAGTVDRLTISLAQLSGTVVEQRALEAGKRNPLRKISPHRSHYSVSRGDSGGHSGQSHALDPTGSSLFGYRWNFVRLSACLSQCSGRRAGTMGT